MAGRARNFRINRAQAWTLSNVLQYTEAGDEAPKSAAGECVINPESYMPEHEAFKFAIQLKEQAPDAVWNDLVYHPDENGWLYFGMRKDGSIKQLEGP